MDSVTNKTRLVENVYRVKKTKANYNDYIHQLQKTKKTTKLQKKKQYEINKGRTLIRKQNESNKETKQSERRQKRENLVEDFDSGSFFE